MATPNTADAANTLAASLNRFADVLEKRNETKADDKPKVEQTDAQAIDGAVNQSREAAQGLDAEGLRAKNAELEAKLAAYETAAKAKRTQQPLRQSTLSLNEAKQELAETAGVLKPETKAFFGNFDRIKTRNAQQYKERFDNRAPLDLLMHGCFVPTDVKMDVGGRHTTWSGFKGWYVGDDEALRRAQDLNDDVFVWQLFMQGKRNVPYVDPTGCPVYPQYREAMAELGKALDTTDTANWVPTGFSSRIIERYELARNLVNQLEVFIMPRNPFQLPAIGARTTTYQVTEQTADPESATAVSTSDLTDLEVTLNLHDFGVRTSWSTNLDEDSIIPIRDRVMREMADSWAFTEEQAIISSDSAGTHIDTDTTEATDARKTWDGLRKMSLDNVYEVDVTNAAVTVEDFVTAFKNMGKYSAVVSDLFIVCGPKQRAQLLNLQDANNNPLVVGSAVSSPTPGVFTITGVPSIYGAPLIVSDAYREDLAADGEYDGVTTDRRSMMIVNRRGPIYSYTNAAPMTFTDTNIRTLQFEVVMNIRREFEGQLDESNERFVESIINIAA